MTGFEAGAALVAAWLANDVEDWWEGETHCIEATKFGLAVLRELGVPARQLPCGVLVANAPARDLTDRGVPISEWPDEAWSVGVDPDVRLGDRGWDGHLVIVGDGWLADLAAGQFARPAIQIEAFCVPLPPDPEHYERWTWVHHDTDVSVTVVPRPELRRYKSSSAWRTPAPSKLVNDLAQWIRDRPPSLSVTADAEATS